MDVIQVIITAVATLPIGIFVGAVLATKHWLIDRPNETAAYLCERHNIEVEK